MQGQGHRECHHTRKAVYTAVHLNIWLMVVCNVSPFTQLALRPLLMLL